MKKNIFLTSAAAGLIIMTFTASGRGSVSDTIPVKEAIRLSPVDQTPEWIGLQEPTARMEILTESGARRTLTEQGQRHPTILTPKSQVVVLNRVPGMITTLEMEEGDRVRQGEVLATIERDSYKLRAARAAAEAARTRAIYERNLEAFEEDARIRIVSELELVVSRAEYIQAQVDSALAAKELAYTDITAPIAGHVIERRIQVGQWIGMQEECFTIADLNTLWAVFTVPQNVAAGLSVSQSMSLTVDPTGDDPDTVSGRLVLISPVVDPGGGVKITIEWRRLAGARQLRAGMTVALEPGED